VTVVVKITVTFIVIIEAVVM